MTDRLKETFDLPDLEDIIESVKNDTDSEIVESCEEDEIETSLVYSNKLDEEMDKVITIGLENFKEMIDYSYNIEAKNAAGVMTAAAKLLEITVNASKLKQDQKLKLFELQMKKELQDHTIKMEKGGIKKGELTDKITENSPEGSKIVNRTEFIQSLKNKN